MAKGLFNKEFWSKRRKIVAGVLAGVSIAAVAVAVPVALTSGSKSGSSPAVQPPEVREVQDEQKNEKYTKTVVYGTPVEQALKDPITLDGYAPGVLDKAKTTYTPKTDAGTEGIVAVYVYASMSGGAKKELIVGVLISKAPVADYDFTVEQAQLLLASLTAFPVYDFSSVALPDGRVITNKIAKYSLTDFGSPLLSISDLNALPAKTKVTASYVVGVDKNHEGPSGSLHVRYEVSRKAITGAKNIYRPVMFSLKGTTPASISIADPLDGYELQSSGYFKYTVASSNGTSIKMEEIKELSGGEGFSKVDTYRLKAGLDGIATYSVTQPYVVMDEDNKFVYPTLAFDIYYGSSITLEPPAQQTGYGAWSAPFFKLVSFPSAEKNNHDEDYDSVDVPITIDRVSEIPANSFFTVTYSTTKNSGSESISYQLNFSVLPALLGLPDVLQTPMVESNFGNELTVAINSKPGGSFGSSASFEMSNLSYVIGKQTDGETGIYVNGYVLTTSQENAAVPVGSVVFVYANAKPSSDNVDPGSKQRLVMAFRITAPLPAVAEKKRSLVYGALATELSKTLPAALTGYKAPVLDETKTTYKPGLVVDQVSTAVYSYASNDVQAPAAYASFEVGVTAAPIDDYEVTSVELPIEAHREFPVLNALDMNLPEGRVLKELTPKYYDGKVDLEALRKKESIGETTKIQRIMEIGSGQYFSAVYSVHYDDLRYTGTDGWFVAFYKVEPPIPVEIQYLPAQKLPVSNGKVDWTRHDSPDVGFGWHFHSAYLNVLDYVEGVTLYLPSYLDEDLIIQKINEYDWEENYGNFLEIIWSFMNEDGSFLWAVTPYSTPFLEAPVDYYVSFNIAKAKLYYSTRIKDLTGNFISRKVDQLSATKSNVVSDEFDSESDAFMVSNDFTLLAPAGTRLILKYRWTFSATLIPNSGYVVIFPRLIYGKSWQGSNTDLRAGVGLGTVKLDSPAPFPFGQKNNDEPNKNRAVYDNPVYLVTKRAPSNPGIYVEGKTLQGLEDVSKLPVGTVFTVTTSAAEINDNYRAVSKQYLVDTFTIVE